MSSDTMVIIGGGQAGGWGAVSLREAGYQGRVLVICAEDYIPYERPPLSKSVLAGDEEFESTYLRPQAYYDEQNIELRLGDPVTHIDPAAQSVALSSGESLNYSRLMVATGGMVRRLTIAGGELPGVFYLRDIDESMALKNAVGAGTRVVVIGGGFIGLEVAAAARKRGGDVVVIEVQPHILNRVIEPTIAAAIVSVHADNGVPIRVDTGLQAITGEGRVDGVQLSSGERIAADVVAIGIGITPDTGLAEAAGLNVDNGIVVNEFGETSQANIYAAGDVTNHYNPLYEKHLRLESWQNAQNQGIAVGRTMAGQREPYAEVPWFWSDQYDMNLQMAGLTDTFDASVTRGNVESRQFSTFYLNAGKVRGVVAINAARDMMVARRLIAKGTPVDVEALADAETNLKKLAKG